MTEVHVIPAERTTWRVYETGARASVTEHMKATEADLAAEADRAGPSRGPRRYGNRRGDSPSATR
jgi:hypothetical protein